jgi:exonuclease SbcC
MIKTLQIDNFQSHKDSYLDFDKGVNMIIGSSDSGKTAIIRALRWLIWNRPQGDSMRSHWGGETKVELFTDDAHVVRIRDKQDEYILGDTHFRAIRTEVPKEIQEALNLTELNLQLQLDRPFLIDNTPGEVAVFFNKVARLDKIDLGNQNVNRWITQLNQVIGSPKTKDKPSTGLYKQIEEQETELQKYEHLEKFEAEVEVLESLDKKLTGLNNHHNKLAGIISDNQQIIDVLTGYSELTDMENEVQEILDLFEEREKSNEYTNHLSSLISNYQSWQLDIDKYENLLSLEDSVVETLVLFENFQKVKVQYTKLNGLLAEYDYLIADIVKEEKYQKQYETQFAELMPNQCPLCQSNIEHKH